MPMANHLGADSVVVLDFETTGLSPQRGDRAIEIGAVRLEQGQVVERFQSLMNPGRRVSSFIENYTGITNAMLADAPPCEDVMAAFADFLRDANVVAHNMSFDRRFLDAELARIGRGTSENYACSLLLSRRVYPEAPSHKLAALVAYRGIIQKGRFHRALADAEVTGQLWLQGLNTLRETYGVGMLSFAQIQALTRLQKAKIPAYLKTLQA